jgi:hypothetical protein
MMAAALGCGGSDSPEEKCDDLIGVVCDRAVECVPGAGTRADCVQQLQSAIPCGMAQSVTDSYDRCMDQLNDNSCAVLFPVNPDTGQMELVLPADCNGVIQVGREAEVSWAPAEVSEMAGVVE